MVSTSQNFQIKKTTVPKKYEEAEKLREPTASASASASASFIIDTFLHTIQSWNLVKSLQQSLREKRCSISIFVQILWWNWLFTICFLSNFTILPKLCTFLLVDLPHSIYCSNLHTLLFFYIECCKFMKNTKSYFLITEMLILRPSSLWSIPSFLKPL